MLVHLGRGVGTSFGMITNTRAKRAKPRTPSWYKWQDTCWSLDYCGVCWCVLVRTGVGWPPDCNLRGRRLFQRLMIRVGCCCMKVLQTMRLFFPSGSARLPRILLMAFVSGSEDRCPYAVMCAHSNSLAWALSHGHSGLGRRRRELCFSVALLMIGFVTVIIGDMAELLGCCLGTPRSPTPPYDGRV